MPKIIIILLFNLDMHTLAYSLFVYLGYICIYVSSYRYIYFTLQFFFSFLVSGSRVVNLDVETFVLLILIKSKNIILVTKFTYEIYLRVFKKIY